MSGTKMRRVYLARHGEAEEGRDYYDEGLGRPDPPLSAEGRKQAQRLAEALARLPIRAIYSSDLRRALETAEPAARHLGLKIAERAGLREIHMGELHRLSWGELRAGDEAAYEAFMRHDADLPYPGGGESGADAAHRAALVMEEALSATEGDVLLVCHGGIIRSLIAGVLGLPQEKRFLLGEPLRNAGLSALFVEAGRVGLDFFNENLGAS